ncbi:MAG: hypothetical protein OXT07_02015 [bacterium]|nr:hypothetical protein [bacterium]
MDGEPISIVAGADADELAEKYRRWRESGYDQKTAEELVLFKVS